MVGPRICGHHLQPAGEAGILVGEQGNQPGTGGRHDTQRPKECLARRRVLLKRLAGRQQAAFPQQAARACLKAREEEKLAQAVGLR
ncbi:hypothetical protein D3C86_1727450 [compost metagenome]